MALPLIKDKMWADALSQVAEWKRLSGIDLDSLDSLDNFFNRDRMMLTLNPIAKLGYPDAVDYAILAMTCAEARTFLFDTEQIRLFMRAIDKKTPPKQVDPPFPAIVVQFTEPMPEEELTTGEFTWALEMQEAGIAPEALRSTGDKILGFVVAFAKTHSQGARVIESDDDSVVNVILFYESGSLNRAAANIHGDGTVTKKYTEGRTTAGAELDKQRIVNLAMLTIAYINSPGIEAKKIEAPEAVNKRRIREDKKPIEPYYVCKVDRTVYSKREAGSEPTGRHVSFRFEVRGHFRHYPSGKSVWIRPHQRGLEHEKFVPKVYKVKGEE